MTKEYYAVATGNKLVREPNRFYWRGRWFHGLVDRAVQPPALYDDPEDSFCDFVGITSSLAQGLITLKAS